MGSTTYSDPGFAVAQPSIRLGTWKKKVLVLLSLGIVRPNGTGQNSNDEPFAFFLSYQSWCTEHYSLRVVAWLPRSFPVPVPSTYFSLFQSAEIGRLATVIDRHVKTCLVDE